MPVTGMLDASHTYVGCQSQVCWMPVTGMLDASHRYKLYLPIMYIGPQVKTIIHVVIKVTLLCTKIVNIKLTKQIMFLSF